MKKSLKFLATSLLCVLMCSQLCFAAENPVMSERMKEQSEVKSEVLELANIPAGSSAQVQPRIAFVVITEGGNLNVRSGPGTNYSVIGQFANGAALDMPYVTPACPPGWDYVYGDDCHTGKRIGGYVSSQYIKQLSR